MKAGTWKRRQAVAAARRASPAHGRHAVVALWRCQYAARGNGVVRRDACVGRPGERASAKAGRARELGWAEASAARDGVARRVGRLRLAGQKGGDGP